MSAQVGDLITTEAEYAALPAGSIIAVDGELPWTHIEPAEWLNREWFWSSGGHHEESSASMAGTDSRFPGTIYPPHRVLRVGDNWETEPPYTKETDDEPHHR